MLASYRLVYTSFCNHSNFIKIFFFILAPNPTSTSLLSQLSEAELLRMIPDCVYINKSENVG